MHLLLLLIALSLYSVLAIEFKNKEHSNYGTHNNKEHIQEHLKSLQTDEDTPSTLSDEDMVYYMFLTHDTNGDGHLDGHELRHAFTDFGDDHVDSTQFLSLDEVTDMVDHVLQEDDLNGDGLISWAEYLESQLYHGQNIPS
ncbi:hypothetical protein BDB01DRAFT_791426 [Pilobolus umbonatus]|nr:hypothetical protein BDB01DRAFT_791426 [Pilobolus umbonatus]